MSEDHDHGDGHAHHDSDRHATDHAADHGHDSHDHEHHGGDFGTVGYAVLTVSSSRGIDADESGAAIVSVVESGGDEVVIRELVPDDFDTVQARTNRLVERDDVDVLITTGGTGVTPDDVTVEAIRPLFDKELPGFGELFRSLSREAVGTAVIATRAVAGVADGVPVFVLPGSENAARLGVERIVTHEAAHLAGLARE